MKDEIIDVEPARTTTALTTTPEQSLTPMAIIQQAVATGADVEKLEKLMALQERWEKNEASKAFTVAMNKFKEAKIVVSKNKNVAFGNTRYNHATLENVCDTLGEELGKHGLSFRWRTEQVDGGKVRVTCILTHVLGHSESSWMEAAPDTSGQKNSIQAIGSVITYLQRYTALAVTGTATGDMDDDARGVFDDAKLQGHIFAIYETKTKGELVGVFMRAASEAAGDKKAFKKLEQVRDEQLAKIEEAKRSEGKND
jgi:ERF superfamily